MLVELLFVLTAVHRASAVFTVWAGLLVWHQYSSYSIEILRFRQAASHLLSTAMFLQFISDVLLLITFVELGSGFLLCMNGGQPTSSRRLARSLILGWGFLLLVLSITFFGLTQSTAVESGKEDGWSGGSASPLRDVQLTAAVHILMWLTSLVVLIFASIVTHKTRTSPMLRNVRLPLNTQCSVANFPH